MKKIYLKEITDLISENKIVEAISKLLDLSIEFRGFYNEVNLLSNQFHKWEEDYRVGLNPPLEDRNRIIKGLLGVTTEIENELNKMVEKAVMAEKKGNERGAKNIVEKVIGLVENENLRDYKSKLNEKLLKKTVPVPSKVEDFSLIGTFIITVLVIIFPFVFLGYKPKFNLDLAYFINLILQISLLTWMVLYSIKPQIVVDDFIQGADDYIWKKFNNEFDELKWFSGRANEAIKQFGIWWRRLGFSYLALYGLYYFSWILVTKELNFLPANFEDYVDVIVNGSEGFFLFIIYRIVTDDTIKPSASKDNPFEEDLNIRNEFYTAVVLICLFLLGSFIYMHNPYQYGIFTLISRTFSGTIVAVGLGLVIGRLDSKFIEAKKWELMILYAYAAIQLLFTLFDKSLFEYVTPSDRNIAVKDNVVYIKTIVLYFILFLKFFFIYFVIKTHRSNELFYYFLLGSKLNDEIKEGKEKSIMKRKNN